MNKENYGGFLDSALESVLENYGITKDVMSRVIDIVDGIAKNVQVKEVGDETHVTIKLNKIHFKFKKENENE